MSIKNPQQDLYETIQFVREGKEEDDQVDEKLNPQQRNMKRAAQIKTGGRVAGGQAAIQKKAGGDKGSSKARRGTRYLRPQQGGGEHMTKGTTGELEAKRHGKQLAARGAGGKDDSNTKQDQERLKQKLRAKRTESFDGDDNAIIEEIKNRVLAVLDERNKE